VLAEFATLGGLSGLLAAVGASVGAYFLTTHWLDLRYAFEFLPWVEGSWAVRCWWRPAAGSPPAAS